MSDCANHKKDVHGVTDMKLLAEAVGDLHYQTLAEFIGRLGTKLYKDGLKVRMNNREKLGYALTDASDELMKAGLRISEAWKISKPFMNKDKNK